MSAKNRKLRPQFLCTHQNWTIEDVAWSADSWFLLQHLDNGVKIWCKQHESTDPPCLDSMVQVSGGVVMVWWIFSWRIWAHSTNWALFKCLSLSHVANHADPFRPQCTHHLIAISSRITHHATKLRSSQTRFVTWQWVHCTHLGSTFTRYQSNRAPLWCD